MKQVKSDCRYFRGDIPCKPHKKHGVHCFDKKGNPCSYYDKTSGKILIIKLGAIGDVIRTTPILHKLKEKNPKAEIWWLTLTPEVVPSIVDVVLPFTVQSITTLQAVKFDIIYNFDKDKEASALCSMLSANSKKGFTLKNGKCSPINKAAEHKFITGLFDDVNKANTKSYLDEIFKIAGFKFKGEKYILENGLSGFDWKLPKNKKIVGLNTGCGGRWTSRLWPEKYWVELAKKLKKVGYIPLLLGGEQEHAKNLKIAKQSGAKYLGHFPLKQFMSEVNQCDLIVTAVTMAMHITIGLGKKIVLFNNIFNRNEFELYGLGEILEPEFDCNCYFSPTCKNNCMQYIHVDRVFNTIQNLLNK
ncbi:MAG: glycosyltransferase family 9 protein [Bacteroidetes bacterium]|nr:glycosyltransferase family 9 protein [Bacteroidota bacterium]MBU1422064.1 glycosyltransferase family 9 protein [Bacteroidota bacterium]MBU2636395.1 glycosyltransferase family 9 protein [Bacteroidota bacterium]